MAVLRSSCCGFACAINSKEGGYVFNLSKAAEILVHNEESFTQETGGFQVDLHNMYKIWQIVQEKSAVVKPFQKDCTDGTKRL